MSRERRGALFYAESAIWTAAEQERARRAETAREVVKAPLIEQALLHMQNGEVGRFMRWRASLPEGRAQVAGA